MLTVNNNVVYEMIKGSIGHEIFKDATKEEVINAGLMSLANRDYKNYVKEYCINNDITNIEIYCGTIEKLIKDYTNQLADAYSKVGSYA